MSHVVPRSAPNKAAVSGTLSTTGRCKPRLALAAGARPSGSSPSDLAAQKQDRTQRLVLGTRGYALPHCQVGQVIPGRFRIEPGVRDLLPLGEIREEPAHPVGVAALGSI
jgi:hypothetical protein